MRSECLLFSWIIICLKLVSWQKSVLVSLHAPSHYHFTRLNPKKKGTLQFCLPALLGIHRHPMQKEFFRSTEGFLRAALTGHGHPGPLWKIAKMALFNPCMEFQIFLGQMSSFDALWKCHLVIFSQKCPKLRPCAF